MARRCFYSFHYKRDADRVSQVRNIGLVEGNRPASDNEWETVASQGDSSIRRWISRQMEGRSCTVVLIGSRAANRKWINHEIIESWNSNMGVVGIYIHGLRNLERETSDKGANPFGCLSLMNSRKPLSSVLKCYDPPGATSKERYAWIAENLSDVVEEAIRIRERC